jgi:FkbM family methyltransferase
MDRIGQATGYYLLPEWRLRHWSFARHLKDLFDRLHIDLVLDVGANKGQYRDFLRNAVGYGGPVVSFEPIRHNVELLRQRVRGDAQWTVHGCALGPASGTRPLNVMQTDSFSSFLAPDNRESSVKLVAHNTVDHVEQVTVRALADLWPEIAGAYGTRIRPYLKMDTQGFDLQVIEGARPIIPSIVAAQTELLLRPLYEGAPSYTDTLLAFERLGFDVAGLFPLTHDTRMRVRACDCTLINRHFGSER